MPDRDPRPPRLWALLARLLLRGESGSFVRQDLEESYARDLSRGMMRGRAGRRYAFNLFGSTLSVWAGGAKRLLLRGTLLDAKLGFRMLAKQPLLTGVAMLALGLGIPSSLAMHHMLGVLLGPLPVPEGERVLGIRHWSAETYDPEMSSVHDFQRWREILGSFESIGAARSYAVNLHTGDPGAPPVRGAQMSASAFDVLSAQPLMGRLIGPADETRDAPDVVLLSEDLWAARFARDPGIVGKTVAIGRRQHTVVGVMPEDFRFPNDDDVWLPLRARPVDYALGEGPRLWVFGRLADGVSAEDAALEMRVVTERVVADHPDVYARVLGEVVDMPILLIGEDQLRNDPEILLVQSIMLAMLLIVCGNVGVLILARNATRMAEISIRTALGASRARVVSQLFIEALVLAVAATGLGLLVAEATARWLMQNVVRFGLLPYWMDLTLRPESVAVALGLAVVCAVVAGVLPAIKATRTAVQANLQDSGARGSTLRFGFGSSLLIVSEVVLAVGFLAMGGMLIRNFFQDTDGQLGFRPESYMSAWLNVPWLDPAEFPEYADEAVFRLRVQETQQQVLARLAADPAVRGVGMGLQLPGTMQGGDPILLESGADGEGVWHRALAAPVDVGFLRGLGRPILAGRDFTAADLEEEADGHRSAVIVNTSFVEQVLGGRNAIGQRFRHPPGIQSEIGLVRGEVDPEEEAARGLDGTDPGRYRWYEIIGVVGSFGMNPVNPTLDAGVYYPIAPGETNPVAYLVEVDGDPASFATRFREVVASVDPLVTVDRPMVLSELMEAEAGVFRWISLMLVALAGVAFLLSASGLYALMSFTVAQRTREIGIRTALGAHPWAIVSAIARRAAIQLAVGLALGGVWGWVLLDSLRDDSNVQPINAPLILSLTLFGAAIIGTLACAVPTRRGLRIEPTEALRES